METFVLYMYVYISIYIYAFALNCAWQGIMKTYIFYYKIIMSYVQLIYHTSGFCARRKCN